MYFLKEMNEMKQRLESLGFAAEIPIELENVDYKQEGPHEQSAKRKIERDLINEHYRKILKSDAILIVNHDKKGIPNYIGGNSLLEMGFAFVHKRDIFIFNDIPDLSYTSEIQGMQPIVLNGKLEKINEHHDSLPFVYVSSESVLKMRAVALGLRELGKRVKVLGIKTASGVSEQPMSFDETFEGAKNRLENLKRQVTAGYEYLFSLEGGLANIITNQGYYDVHVCVVENVEGTQSHAVAASIEFPKEVTDLVPDTYADLGVWVQKEFGLKEKDPVLYLTHGKVPREPLLRQAVMSAFAMLEK